MAHLIDKDAVVAEVEKRIADNKKDIERASHKNLEDYFEGYEDALALFKQQFLDTLEVKEVDLEDKVDKDDYRKLFEDSTKLNIDSITEINLDESTKFNLCDYIKMKEKEKINSSKFYKKMFKNIPIVSMKIFSWWDRNKRKENEL